VDDVSFEDDEEEEEAQQHVTEVTEDVVERTAYDKKTKRVTEEKNGSVNVLRSQRADDAPQVPQRVGAQEVVEADVLVSRDVDHLKNRESAYRLFSPLKKIKSSYNLFVSRAVPSDR